MSRGWLGERSVAFAGFVIGGVGRAPPGEWERVSGLSLVVVHACGSGAFVRGGVARWVV